MFGTLVLVLPTQHEGGALAFNHSGQQWAFDSAKALSGNLDSIAYVAFLGDMKHEVLPVLSGYRVTLTYNLHYSKEPKVPASIVSLCDYPGLEEMRHSLFALLGDPEFLPNGGLIGFGLSHRYPFDINRTEPPQIYHDLRGPDALLGDLCRELGIDVSLKALYHNDDQPDFCLVDSFVSKYHINTEIEDSVMDLLVNEYDAIYCRDAAMEHGYCQHTEGDETTPVVWIKALNKSNALESIDAVYGNESSWGTLYGELCLVAAVVPASERLPGANKRARSNSATETDNLAKKVKTVVLSISSVFRQLLLRLYTIGPSHRKPSVLVVW